MVLLFVHTGNETGGLHYTMTLHTLYFRMFEILHVLCLSLSSHYGFKSSSGRVQFVQEKLLYQRYHTTAGFKSVSQYTVQQRVDAVKNFSRFLSQHLTACKLVESLGD